MTEISLDGRQKSAELCVFAELMQTVNHWEDYMLKFRGMLAVTTAASDFQSCSCDVICVISSPTCKHEKGSRGC